ncbi:MAG: hypothetical protein JNL74_13245 [Fibrobacteres bacterium]|nr:hypothetical protein [Fibrobacterota bacterium]
MEKGQRLIRTSIPVLNSKDIKLGKEGQIYRSWSVTPGDFFRIYKDEPLYLEVNFREDLKAPKVVLYTDMLSKGKEWSEIEFEKVTPNNFRISVNPKRCGIFQFKIKHSPDNGKSWFWDRVPFTKVIVDPAGAKDIRMYTLLPTATGNITAWKRELTHIKNLGFNMIHLLPITAMDESESPYAAADLFDVDHSFRDAADKRGALEQFEDFVEVAKENGIRLCMDLVLNHIGIKSNVARMKPEWLIPDRNESDSLMRAGCWHMNKWIKWEDLVKINYDHPEEHVRKELTEYMKQYALFWANYAAYTGGMVRFDNLHSSHTGFIYDLILTLRKKYPELVIQAEFFSDSNTLLKTASECELNLLLANPWEHPFAEDLRDYISYLHEISPELLFLNPLTTHDTGAPAQLYGKAEAAIPRYFALALMGTGQTGIVQGTEHGVLEKIEFIGRNRSAAYPEMNRYSDMIRKINGLHNRFPLFHQGRNIRFVDGKHGAVLACIREDKKGDQKVLLAANMDTTGEHMVTLDLTPLAAVIEKVKLTDAFSGQSFMVDSDMMDVLIEPCGVRAFIVGR